MSEGDAINKTKISRMSKKLRSLRLFKTVEILERELDNNFLDLDINVEETQTGTVNAGFSFGTLDGLGVVAGLSEKKFLWNWKSFKSFGKYYR